MNVRVVQSWPALCVRCGEKAVENIDMHELGVAQNIVDIVRQSIPVDREASVKKIRIRIGQLSGVVAESLEFCFHAIVSETGMKQAGLVMETMPTVSRCTDCGHQFRVDDFAFTCPACESVNLEMLSGRELEIVDIELSDE